MRRQRFHLPAQSLPARAPRAVETFELRQFDFHGDLFENLRIAAGDRLDLRGGHYQLVNVFGGPRRYLAGHDLADEARLAFDQLPLISVE